MTVARFVTGQTVRVRKPRIGVVLGVGGLVGLGYHVHVLSDLRRRGLLDIDDAEVLVGTSAGSLVGGLLASGVTLDELRAAIDPSADSPLAGALARLLGLRASALAALKRPERPPRGLGERRSRAALWSTSLFADGDLDALDLARGFDALLPTAWPDRLQVCSLTRDTGIRAVWGPHRTTSLATAVAASCAVPGIFRPVDIAGELHVDGGFWSPTNADVLLGRHLDHVVIVSPMSAPPGSLPVTADHPLRIGLHMLVAREARALRRHGVPVTVIEPTRAVRQAMGVNFMASDRIPSIEMAIVGSPGPSVLIAG